MKPALRVEEEGKARHSLPEGTLVKGMRREHVIDDSMKLMDELRVVMWADSPNLGAAGENGFGAGVTQGYYAAVCEALLSVQQNEATPMWVDCSARTFFQRLCP